MNAKEYFHNKCSFETDVPSLPCNVFVTEKWKLSSLQERKDHLNSVKSLLHDFDLKKWANHTRNRDPSSLVVRFMKFKYGVELPTQAWCKFYECLGEFQLIPEHCFTDTGGYFSSFHLCEAPGAFITALNHYLTETYKNLKWVWSANTLNPFYEGNKLTQMVPDDRLVKYTLDKWHFGLDGTGDITTFYNYLHIIDRFKEDKVWLVTADGSVDCMFNPGDQELIVEYLHYCEIIIALSVLQKGGNFVMKIFTTFEESTICYLYLLKYAFQTMVLFKPGTSKGGNSETYVICKNYKGLHCLSNIWQSLLQPFQCGTFNNKSMFNIDDINKKFLEEIHQTSEHFMMRQIAMITANISHFTNEDPQDVEDVKEFQKSVVKYFVSKYKVRRIPNNKKIVPYIDVLWFWKPLCNQKVTEIRKFNCKHFITAPENIDIFYMQCGKCIEKVHNSKFCSKQFIPRKSECRLNNGSLYTLSLKSLNKSCLVINIRNFDTTSFYLFQKGVFYAIYNNLWKNNLVFLRIPFVTHFLVGLLFLLFAAYRDVHLHPCGALILSNPEISDTTTMWFKTIHNLYQSIDIELPFTCDLNHIVHPLVLCDNTFFEFVECYNNLIS